MLQNRPRRLQKSPPEAPKSTPEAPEGPKRCPRGSFGDIFEPLGIIFRSFLSIFRLFLSILDEILSKFGEFLSKFGDFSAIFWFLWKYKGTVAQFWVGCSEGWPEISILDPIREGNGNWNKEASRRPEATWRQMCSKPLCFTAFELATPYSVREWRTWHA